MTVGTRVSDTIDKMEISDPEGALFQICAAIDATAKTEFGKSGGSSYKNFIHQNLGLITDIAFGGCKILNLHLEYDHPKLKKNTDGCVPVQEILYHVVRCGLYHDASLPKDLKFTDERQIRTKDGVLVLPSALIYGLIIAVVVSPVNCGEHVPKKSTLNLGGFPIPINKLWGCRDELLWLLDVVDENKRLQAAATAS